MNAGAARPEYSPPVLSIKADFMTDLHYTNHMNKALCWGTARPKDHSRTCHGPHPALNTHWSAYIMVSMSYRGDQCSSGTRRASLNHPISITTPSRLTHYPQNSERALYKNSWPANNRPNVIELVKKASFSLLMAPCTRVKHHTLNACMYPTNLPQEDMSSACWDSQIKSVMILSLPAVPD